MRIVAGGVPRVEAEERWFTEIRRGRGFVGGVFNGASAGNFSEIQLRNPAASGVTLLVRDIVLTVSATNHIDLRDHDAALATLGATGTNLLKGAAAANGQVRTATPAARDGTVILSFRLAGDTPLRPVPDWLFELGAGEGFLFTPNVVNVGLTATFAWIEIPD